MVTVRIKESEPANDYILNDAIICTNNGKSIIEVFAIGYLSVIIGLCCLVICLSIGIIVVTTYKRKILDARRLSHLQKQDANISVKVESKEDEKSPLLTDTTPLLSVEEISDVRYVATELHNMPRVIEPATMPSLAEVENEDMSTDARESNATVNEVELAVHDISSRIPVYDQERPMLEPRVLAEKAVQLLRQPSANLSSSISSIRAEKVKIKGSVQTIQDILNDHMKAPSIIMDGQLELSDRFDKKASKQSIILDKISSLIDEIYSKSTQSSSSLQTMSNESLQESSPDNCESSDVILSQPTGRKMRRRSTGRFSERPSERSDDSVETQESKSNSSNTIDSRETVHRERINSSQDAYYENGSNSKPYNKEETLGRRPDYTKGQSCEKNYMKNSNPKYSHDINQSILEELSSVQDKTTHSFREKVFTEELAWKFNRIPPQTTFKWSADTTSLDKASDIGKPTTPNSQMLFNGITESPVYTDAYTVDRSSPAKSKQSQILQDVQIDALLEELGSMELKRSMDYTDNSDSFSEGRSVASSNSADGSRTETSDNYRKHIHESDKRIPVSEYHVKRSDGAEYDKSPSNLSRNEDAILQFGRKISDGRMSMEQNQSMTGTSKDTFDYSSLRPQQSEPFTVSEMDPSSDILPSESKNSISSKDINSFDRENKGPLHPLLEKVKRRSCLSILDPVNFGQDISEFLEEICTVDKDDNASMISIEQMNFEKYRKSTGIANDDEALKHLQKRATIIVGSKEHLDPIECLVNVTKCFGNDVDTEDNLDTDAELLKKLQQNKLSTIFSEDIRSDYKSKQNSVKKVLDSLHEKNSSKNFSRQGHGKSVNSGQRLKDSKYKSDITDINLDKHSPEQTVGDELTSNSLCNNENNEDNEALKLTSLDSKPHLEDIESVQEIPQISTELYRSPNINSSRNEINSVNLDNSFTNKSQTSSEISRKFRSANTSTQASINSLLDRKCDSNKTASSSTPSRNSVNESIVDKLESSNSTKISSVSTESHISPIHEGSNNKINSTSLDNSTSLSTTSSKSQTSSKLNSSSNTSPTRKSTNSSLKTKSHSDQTSSSSKHIDNSINESLMDKGSSLNSTSLSSRLVASNYVSVEGIRNVSSVESSEGKSNTSIPPDHVLDSKIVNESGLSKANSDNMVIAFSSLSTSISPGVTISLKESKGSLDLSKYRFKETESEKRLENELLHNSETKSDYGIEMNKKSEQTLKKRLTIDDAAKFGNFWNKVETMNTEDSQRKVSDKSLGSSNLRSRKTGLPFPSCSSKKNEDQPSVVEQSYSNQSSMESMKLGETASGTHSSFTGLVGLTHYGQQIIVDAISNTIDATKKPNGSEFTEYYSDVSRDAPVESESIDNIEKFSKRLVLEIYSNIPDINRDVGKCISRICPVPESSSRDDIEIFSRQIVDQVTKNLPKIKDSLRGCFDMQSERKRSNDNVKEHFSEEDEEDIGESKSDGISYKKEQSRYSDERTPSFRVTSRSYDDIATDVANKESFLYSANLQIATPAKEVKLSEIDCTTAIVNKLLLDATGWITSREHQTDPLKRRGAKVAGRNSSRDCSRKSSMKRSSNRKGTSSRGKGTVVSSCNSQRSKKSQKSKASTNVRTN